MHWISWYLASHSQSVEVNGESSLPVPVISGVPQGSVLGPLLFLIYIYDLALRDGVKVTLYADDVLLFWVINSPEDFAKLQDDIGEVRNWSWTSYITLNRGKCKCMIVSSSIYSIITTFAWKLFSGTGGNIRVFGCCLIRRSLLEQTCSINLQ